MGGSALFVCKQYRNRELWNATVRSKEAASEATDIMLQHWLHCPEPCWSPPCIQTVAHPAVTVKLCTALLGSPADHAAKLVQAIEGSSWLTGWHPICIVSQRRLQIVLMDSNVVINE